MKTLTFKILDIDTNIVVELSNTQKEIFDWMDEYIENLQYDWYDGSDMSFKILYKDGTEDIIDMDYDGHKVKRNNIKSLVFDNPSTSMAYGTYQINEYGVVNTSDTINISKNIMKL